MAMRPGRGRARFAWPARVVDDSQDTQADTPLGCSPQPQDTPCGSGNGQSQLPLPNQEQNVVLDSQGTQGSTPSQGVPRPLVGHSGTIASGSETQDFPTSSGTRASTSGLPKRLRGPAKNTFINSVKKAMGPMSIEIDPNTGRPTTSEGQKYLPRTIRYLVRALAPMVDKKKWSDIQESEKLPMLTELKSYFDIKDLKQESVRVVIDNYFRDSYKRVRKELYDYYCKLRDQGKDPINLPPQGVTIPNWTFLCNYFQTPEYQHKSAINKENRKKMKYTHCMRPKPFMVALFEMENESPDDHIDRVELFKQTRTRKSGDSFISPEAEADYNKMKDLQASSESAESPMTTDDIYDKVMGKKFGYIKGLGHLPKTTKSRFSPILPCSRSAALEEKLKTTQEELANARTEIAALKDETKEIRSLLSQLINLPTPESLTSTQIRFPSASRGMPNNEGSRDT